MVSGGDLRHHTAVLGVQRYLAVQDVRPEAELRVIDRDASLVAGSFDAEDVHWPAMVARRRPPAQRSEQARYASQDRRNRGPGALHCPDSAVKMSSSFPAQGRVCCAQALKEGLIQMPSVRVKENEYFDAALRRFKRACEKAGVLTELRRREFYEKPTQERKRKKAAAVKRHLKRISREEAKRKRLY